MDLFYGTRYIITIPHVYKKSKLVSYLVLWLSTEFRLMCHCTKNEAVRQILEWLTFSDLPFGGRKVKSEIIGNSSLLKEVISELIVFTIPFTIYLRIERQFSQFLRLNKVK